METTISLLDIRPLVPELTMICVGLIVILLDLIVRKKEVVAIVGIAGTLVALYGTYKLYGFYEPQSAFSGMFVLDGYSNFFKLIFYLNIILTICISFKYMAIEKASFGEYYALLMFATTGMMIMASAADLIVLYLGLELMALSTYILAGITRKRQRSNEAALKYFFLGAFSSAFLLYGISLTYGLTGTTNLREIASALQTLDLNGSPIMYLGLIFMIVAFGFKIALAPFHMWAPDVYEGAPTSITAFMSVGPKAAGFAVLGRVLFGAFAGMQVQWASILIPMAVLTMAVGSIIALAQTNIKRMLAYSSIAHAGYMLLGVITGTTGGLMSTVNYLAIYLFMNIGAFAIVIMLRREGFQGENIEDYMGLSKSHPLASALMLIFMFSLAGIPPTAGFIGKFYVFMEVIKAGYVYLAIIAVAFSAISAFFYLRVVMYIYMKDPKEEVVLTRSPSMSIALAVTAMMVLILGIFPSFLLNLVRYSILG
ncbi:MAG TPA: NADH-quinone oxidoreductase subunit N [Nitrospirae bacterium]|nr:NADH-quinone oxidoreductase subunit N [Nitrospirota bacterium]HDZ02613.1 NADH-quinone oxidoreductase subunit N [Nitrospirota bacterium]